MTALIRRGGNLIRTPSDGLCNNPDCCCGPDCENCKQNNWEVDLGAWGMVNTIYCNNCPSIQGKYILSPFGPSSPCRWAHDEYICDYEGNSAAPVHLYIYVVWYAGSVTVRVGIKVWNPYTESWGYIDFADFKNDELDPDAKCESLGLITVPRDGLSYPEICWGNPPETVTVEVV